jgi:cytochrome c-type biogenesis protein CcmH/NrfG
MRGRRALLVLLVVALAILAFEVLWFSGPAREWRLARLDLAGLERHVAEQPYDTRGLAAYARRLSASGREGEAAGILHRAVVMEPGSRPLLVAMGESMLRLGRLDRAEEYLGEATRRGEKGAAARAALATVYQQQERFAEAGVLWRQVVAERPGDAQAWHALGLCEAKMVRPEEWRDAMARAARLAPLKGEYHRALGEALAYREEWDAAELSFYRALGLDPGDARARYQHAAIRGRKARTRREVDAVLADFRRAAAELPGDPEPWVACGRFLADQRRFDEAAHAFAAALRLDPGHEPAHFQLATALRRAGRALEADRALLRFRRVSDASRAVRYLSARLQLSPDDPELKRRLTRARDEMRKIVSTPRRPERTQRKTND